MPSFSKTKRTNLKSRGVTRTGKKETIVNRSCLTEVVKQNGVDGSQNEVSGFILLI